MNNFIPGQDVAGEHFNRYDCTLSTRRSRLGQVAYPDGFEMLTQYRLPTRMAGEDELGIYASYTGHPALEPDLAPVDALIAQVAANVLDNESRAQVIDEAGWADGWLGDRIADMALPFEMGGITVEPTMEDSAAQCYVRSR